MSCIGILIYCFSISYFDYIKAIEAGRYVKYDGETITAGDYSIEFDIKASTYEYFKETYYNEKCPMSELAQFKLYV